MYKNKLVTVNFEKLQSEDTINVHRVLGILAIVIGILIVLGSVVYLIKFRRHSLSSVEL